MSAYWNFKPQNAFSSFFIKPLNNFLSFFTGWFKPKPVIKNVELTTFAVKRPFNPNETLRESVDNLKMDMKNIERRISYLEGTRAAKEKWLQEKQKSSAPIAPPSRSLTFGR